MAKSLRAKSKQANRRKKRQDENSYYAAVEAARLKKISARLLGKEKEVKQEDGAEVKAEEDQEVEETAEGEEEDNDVEMAGDKKPKKISTSGPRNSGREQWRKAQGWSIRGESKGQNKQLKGMARRKAGVPKRRR